MNSSSNYTTHICIHAFQLIQHGLCTKVIINLFLPKAIIYINETNLNSVIYRLYCLESNGVLIGFSGA